MCGSPQEQRKDSCSSRTPSGGGIRFDETGRGRIWAISAGIWQLLSKKWCWQWWSGENLLLFLATLLLALLHSCLIYIRHSGLVLIAGQLNIQQEQKPDQPWWGESPSCWNPHIVCISASMPTLFMRSPGNAGVPGERSGLTSKAR